MRIIIKPKDYLEFSQSSTGVKKNKTRKEKITTNIPQERE